MVGIGSTSVSSVERLPKNTDFIVGNLHVQQTPGIVPQRRVVVASKYSSLSEFVGTTVSQDRGHNGRDHR